MIGTLINSLAILLGGIIGMIFHSRLPKKIIKIVFQSLGLVTLFIGFSMAIKSNNYLIIIASIVTGSIIGEVIDIEKYINLFASKIKTLTKQKNNNFSDGLVTAFLLYCIGSMTILGAIEEGLGNEPNLLLAKSVMDGFSSIALAAAMGIGVIFSIIPLIIYQGGLTLLASFAGDYFSSIIITEMTSVGGILLIGLGISILEIKKIKVINMLPSLIVVVILAWLFAN